MDLSWNPFPFCSLLAAILVPNHQSLFTETQTKGFHSGTSVGSGWKVGGEGAAQGDSSNRRAALQLISIFSGLI